ncbi:MAG: pyroglutamyl-peptidase I [Bifidobacteriaceae bacterium]|jgi:pyroglutamyl-peptidase|nr:pyroglutamyl-peptidase I [Bifidobacteriaceae bacterium]
MRTYNVVVSGFEPFEDRLSNPSGDVATLLSSDDTAARLQELTGAAITVTPSVLPLSFDQAWPTLLTTIENVHPDIIVSLGHKHSARGVNLERCAINLIDADKPDAYNVQPRKVAVSKNGPAAFWTKLPLRRILQTFSNAQIPASLSSDAGTYVCNALFYQLMAWCATTPDVLAGFVSLPTVNETQRTQNGLPLKEMVEAGVQVIAQTASYFTQVDIQDQLVGSDADAA